MLKFLSKSALFFLGSLVLSSPVLAQNSAPLKFQPIPQPTRVKPYQRATPAIKPNVHGAYPKITNGKAWDGREPGNYSLRFKIKTLTPDNVKSSPYTIFKGDTVFLADHHIGSKYLRDTAVIDKNGVANFTGTQKLQRGMYLFVLPGKRDYFEFIVDDDQDFEISYDTAWFERDYFNKMSATGSLQNAAYINYQRGKTGIIDQLYAVDQQLEIDSVGPKKEALEAKKTALLSDKEKYDSIFIANNPDHLLSRFLLTMVSINIPTQYPTLPNGDKDSSFPYRYFKSHYWDHFDWNEDGLVRMPVNVVKQKLDFFFDKLILPDADSCIQEAERIMAACRNTIEMEKYVIWYLTNRFESSNIMGMDRAFIHMAVSTYGQGRAWWTDSSTITNMCKNAYERWPTTIGQPAPELELKNIKGEWYRTQSTKAPWTIMIFWDPTCGHCKEVMPKLAKTYEKNKSRGWKVIGLASGDKRKEWEEYYNAHPETQQFIHLIRGEVLSERYKQNLFTYFVKSSPTIYVLDENNVIQANRIDIDKLEDFINHLERERYPHLVPPDAPKVESNTTKSNSNNSAGKTNTKTNNKPAKSAGKK